MMKIFFWIVGTALIGALVYAYIMQGGSLPFPAEDMNAQINRALLSATVDADEFGAGMLTLVDGEAVFTPEFGGQGFVMLGGPRDIVVKGGDADVLALIGINGGGTGTFQYLAHFEYIGAEDRLVEVQKILLGDRLMIDGIHAELTAPNEYQVLVSLKDRKPGEGMAAVPSEPRVLHFKRGPDGLELAAVMFGTLEEHDVVLFGPFPEAEIEPTFAIAGAAGGWYFEGSFPIELQTMDGETLAVAVAQAQGDWMTTELVPFKTLMVAPNTAHGLHKLVLKKDNASGLPEHDKSYEIPVVLK